MSSEVGEMKICAERIEGCSAVLSLCAQKNKQVQNQHEFFFLKNQKYNKK